MGRDVVMKKANVFMTVVAVFDILLLLFTGTWIAMPATEKETAYKIFFAFNVHFAMMGLLQFLIAPYFITFHSYWL